MYETSDCLRAVPWGYHIVIARGTHRFRRWSEVQLMRFSLSSLHHKTRRLGHKIFQCIQKEYHRPWTWAYCKQITYCRKWGCLPPGLGDSNFQCTGFMGKRETSVPSYSLSLCSCPKPGLLKNLLQELCIFMWDVMLAKIEIVHNKKLLALLILAQTLFVLHWHRYRSTRREGSDKATRIWRQSKYQNNKAATAY